jgi:sugar phosphate isomerase/epimerase
MSRLEMLFKGQGFTGQWADLPLETMCVKAKQFGYDGLELACWGDHVEVDRAVTEDDYCAKKRALLDKHGLQVFVISNHLVGQTVLDNIDSRHQLILPKYVWGDGNPADVNPRAVEELKNTAKAAQKLGVGVVNGFTGSSIWHLLYSFPPVSSEMIDAGFDLLAELVRFLRQHAALSAPSALPPSSLALMHASLPTADRRQIVAIASFVS